MASLALTPLAKAQAELTAQLVGQAVREALAEDRALRATVSSADSYGNVYTRQDPDHIN